MSGGMVEGWSTILTLGIAVIAAPGQAVVGGGELRFMHGAWHGAGHALLLDTERLMANLDPARPFQRDALLLRNITGRMVLFSVKGRRFVGLFDGDRLSLTGDGLAETLQLQRLR